MNTTTASTAEFLDLPDGPLAYDDPGDGTPRATPRVPANGRVPGLRHPRPAAQGGAPGALDGDCRLHS